MYLDKSIITSIVVNLFNLTIFMGIIEVSEPRSLSENLAPITWTAKRTGEGDTEEITFTIPIAEDAPPVQFSVAGITLEDAAIAREVFEIWRYFEWNMREDDLGAWRNIVASMPDPNQRFAFEVIAEHGENLLTCKRFNTAYLFLSAMYNGTLKLDYFQQKFGENFNPDELKTMLGVLAQRLGLEKTQAKWGFLWNFLSHFIEILKNPDHGDWQACKAAFEAAMALEN